jgi:hypothetical protein
MRPLLFIPAIAFSLTLATAGDDPQKAVTPRTVTFSKPALRLADALAELSKQTDNRVGDQRRQASNPTVRLPAGQTAFWPALDAIGKASGVGFSPYLAEAGVALTDAPYRPVTTVYAGIFRLAVRRLTVSRDEEAQTRHCQLALDVAWEPRFRPFLVDLRQLKLSFAPDTNNKSLQATLPAHGAVSVAGRTAIELDVGTAAPERSCPRIAALTGTAWALGPTKMLAFQFDKLAIQKPGAKGPAAPPVTQEGVTVTLADIRRLGDSLVLTVRIENPKGGPGLESYQSWLENNRMTLSYEQGTKKRALVATATKEDKRDTWARVEYEITESAEQPLPATLDGWRLRYETPGRIVEVTAPFAFKDLALP